MDSSVSSFWLILFGLLLLSSNALSQDNVCDDPHAVQGSGKDKLIRWSYDKTQDICSTFLQTESGRSQNSFVSEEECLRRCSERYSVLYPDGEAVCNLPMESGPCLAIILMWYYDQKQDVCDSFLYGGCQGNGNRFHTKSNCSRTCVSAKKGRFGGAESEEPPPSETDSGLIVGIVCGCVFGVAFLVTLGLYLVQRKNLKKQHKLVPAVEMK
ncbi:inter-alpha-trypsin inhibitor-like [Pelobates fuscus]|uniref:inter-alpha-trypsin inhibitor-like n=1 Tax=Pelobates fuscus TaxID=191477 RepID=UPI002FE43A58